MGVVYRARDPKLQRTVAIKTVSLSASGFRQAEQEFRKRFVIEAQAAGRLSHPGIVTIFDVREEPEPFLVMEYVEGQSLQQLITRESRTPSSQHHSSSGSRGSGGPSLRACPGRGASRYQAGEHSRHPQWSSENCRLRRSEVEPDRCDPARPGVRKSSLHGPGAIDRRTVGCPVRFIFAGRDSLLHAHGASALSGKQHDHCVLQAGQS